MSYFKGNPLSSLCLSMAPPLRGEHMHVSALHSRMNAYHILPMTAVSYSSSSPTEEYLFSQIYFESNFNLPDRAVYPPQTKKSAKNGRDFIADLPSCRYSLLPAPVELFQRSLRVRLQRAARSICKTTTTLQGRRERKAILSIRQRLLESLDIWSSNNPNASLSALGSRFQSLMTGIRMNI